MLGSVGRPNEWIMSLTVELGIVFLVKGELWWFAVLFWLSNSVGSIDSFLDEKVRKVLLASLWELCLRDVT